MQPDIASPSDDVDMSHQPDIKLSVHCKAVFKALSAHFATTATIEALTETLSKLYRDDAEVRPKVETDGPQLTLCCAPSRPRDPYQATDTGTSRSTRTGTDTAVAIIDQSTGTRTTMRAIAMHVTVVVPVSTIPGPRIGVYQQHDSGQCSDAQAAP